MPDQIISQEGYNKLIEELNYFTSIKRHEIAERIERAKELGDLSENAEYADAKDAQAFNEGKIAEITNLLKNLRVVKGDDSGSVGMGSRVMIKANGETKEFVIVSFNEADPVAGKISNESPIGLALLGKKINDKVKIKTPRCDMDYEIIKIS